MIASLLLLSIGLTDLARALAPAVARWILVAIVWAAILVVGVAGIGLSWWVAILVVVATAGWTVTVGGRDTARGGVWPALVLLVVVVVLTVVDPAAAPAGFVATAWDGISLGALEAVDLRTAFAAVAVAVVLTRSGNLVARAALGRSHDRQPMSRSATPERWELRMRGLLVGTVTPTTDTPPAGPVLRGGRMIGPLERLLIVALAFTGAHAIIAALLAAKGIVRFPEISADRGTGSKAEEFLVGSLTSWSMSAAAVLYLAVLAAS